MAEINPPSVMAARADHTASNQRMMQQGLASVSSGVVEGNGLEVTAVAASMLVSISKGSAFIRGDYSSGLQGTYFVQNGAAASVSIPLPTGYGATESANHLVIGKIIDSEYGGAADFWVLEVVSGVSDLTGTQSDPIGSSFPLDAVVLARVTIKGGTTQLSDAGNSITDLRAFTPRALYVADSARPPGATYSPTGIVGTGEGRAPYNGERVFETDTEKFKVYSGGAWKEYARTDASVYQIYATEAARDAAIPSPSGPLTVYINSNDANEGLYNYAGVAWHKGPSWNMPWGLLAKASLKTPSVTSLSPFHTVGQDGSAVSTVTVTTITNRVYRMTTTHYPIASGGANGFRVSHVVDGTSQTIFDRISLSTTHTEGFSYVSTYTETAGASKTFKAQISANATNTAVTDWGGSGPTKARTIVVEDIGPSGAPA